MSVNLSDKLKRFLRLRVPEAIEVFMRGSAVVKGKGTKGRNWNADTDG